MANRFDVKDEHGAWQMRFARALVVALAMTSCGVASAARTYSAAPIKARVVDSKTGVPVEGVNVVAAWEARGGMEGGNIMGYVTVMEDVTNAKGEFSFPAWGPKIWANGAISDGAPRMLLFKPGYKWQQWWESKYSLDNAPSGKRMTSSLDGKTLKLERLQDSDLRSRSIYGLRTPVDSIILHGKCGFRGMPRFLRAASAFNATLSSDFRQSTFVLDYASERADRSCGSLKTYVMEHGR